MWKPWKKLENCHKEKGFSFIFHVIFSSHTENNLLQRLACALHKFGWFSGFAIKTQWDLFFGDGYFMWEFSIVILIRTEIATEWDLIDYYRPKWYQRWKKKIDLKHRNDFISFFFYLEIFSLARLSMPFDLNLAAAFRTFSPIPPMMLLSADEIFYGIGQ